MSSKEIHSFKDVEDKILEAVRKLSDPIRQTLGPKGGNVIIQTDKGEVYHTNDGVTIAREIGSSDMVEDTIIQMVKQGSMQTNRDAGDGTSTTILLSSILIEEGMRMVREGMNQTDVVAKFEAMRDHLIANLEKQKLTISNDDELTNIATISANNDKEVADNVIKTVKVAGEDGIVILDFNTGPETIIKEDKGFIIEQGMFSPELRDSNTSYASSMEDAPVLITDKRIYYKQEAETILGTCIANGYDKVVVVAQDFIGEALPFFVANHRKGVIKVLLVKDPLYKENNGATLEDLAVFLGGKVISEKSGSIVDKLTIDDFVFAERVMSDSSRTLLSRYADRDSAELNARVEMLREERDAKPEGSEKTALSNRIGSLTNGMVTIKIGGATGPEIAEKRFRYEDAVSATRSAMKYGYLPGGGLAIHRAGEGLSTDKYITRYCEANIRQLAINAGQSPELIMFRMSATTVDGSWGFNAKNGQIQDLVKAGIIDPYRVTELAIKNSVSIASAVVGSNYMVVIEKEHERGKDND